MAIFRCNPLTRLLCTVVCGSAGLALAGSEQLAQIESDHGLSLAISGMLIVFMGLLAISGFIGLLPTILAKLEKPAEPRPAPRPMTPKVDGLDPATLTAIALVLHAESERSTSQGMKVTLPLTTSPWALSSQMRVLPSRIHS